MVLVLKKDASKRDIAALRKKLEQRRKTGGVHTKKYCGVIKLKEDPLEIQKRLRNEWE